MGIVTPNVVPASVLLAEGRPAWLTEWGDFAAALRFEDFSGDLVAQAKLILLDCVGAIAAGMQEPEAMALATRLGRRAGGMVPAIGAGLRLQPSDAAFANGVAGTMLELDEGNSFARGHPGIHVLPALLATARPGDVSGKAFLRAYVLGYEIGARIGAASRLRHTIHPHGTWGTVGAALAAAAIETGDAGQLAETISIAAPLSLGASLRAMLEGATVRNAYAGISARNGLAAADLAATGFGGESDGVRSVYGGILAEDFRPGAMTEQLGSRWEMQRNYFKRHAACRFTHAALDVVATLIERHGPIDAEAIESIAVETYVWAAQLDAPAPANMLAAKFSVPFAVATMLVHGAASVPAFRAPALSDPRIARIAAVTRVNENAAFSAMLPAQRPARVAIRLKDGRTLSGETFTNRGDAADPYGPDEVRAKFRELAEPVWGAAHAARIHQAIETLDSAADLTGLDALFAAAPRKDV